MLTKNSRDTLFCDLMIKYYFTYLLQQGARPVKNKVKKK